MVAVVVAAVVQAVVVAAAAVPLFVAVVACQHAQLYRDEKKKSEITIIKIKHRYTQKTNQFAETKNQVTKKMSFSPLVALVLYMCA